MIEYRCSPPRPSPVTAWWRRSTPGQTLNTRVFNHYCTHEGFMFYRWVDDFISGASEQRDKSRKSLRSSDVPLVQIWAINLSLFLRSDSLMYGTTESTTPSRWSSQTLWLLICERLCWTQPVQTRGRKRAMSAFSPPLLLFPHSFSFHRVLLLHRFGAAEQWRRCLPLGFSQVWTLTTTSVKLNTLCNTGSNCSNTERLGKSSAITHCPAQQLETVCCGYF